MCSIRAQLLEAHGKSLGLLSAFPPKQSTRYSRSPSKPNVQTWKANKSVLFKSWLLIPIGVFVMLLLVMGVTELIALTGISFPASVFSRALRDN